MKKYPKFLSIVIALFLFTATLSGQTRYNNEVFSDIQVTNDVMYGANYSVLTGAPILDTLLMDVYWPADDTAGHPNYEATRPLIILTHAGSFLPKDVFLPFGYKNDSMLIEMCTQFAKRGWVAVSMTYRVGWNPLGADETTRKTTIINAVYRAMQDMKACVRYFRKDAGSANTYRIDPYRIAVGGSNSGGYVALATAALNKPSEIVLLKFLNPTTGNSVIDTSVTGGFFGEGGCQGVNAPLNHPGYSSAVQVVLTMGGAIGDTSWIEAGEPPIVAFHGVADPLTPYETAVVIVSATGQPVVEVSGSHDLIRRADNEGNQDIFHNLNLTDPYTQAAESRTSYEGLLGFSGAANGYEPWAWYDCSLEKIARPDATHPTYSGYGSAANPFATRAKAELYIDSIMNYFTPRALEAFNNIDSVEVNTPDRNATPVSCRLGAQNSWSIKYNKAPSAECVTSWTSIAFNNISDAAVQIYPNPSSSDVNVQVLDGKYSMETVKLLDISGKEIRNEKLDGEPYHVIKRNGLEAGIYFINIGFRDGKQTFRQVVFE